MCRSAPPLRGLWSATTAAVIGAAALCSVLPPAQAADAEPRIVVLKEDFAPFHQAAQGFTAALAGAGLRPRMREVILDRKRPKRALDQMREHNPEVVISIGTTATLISKKEFPELPIVFAMVVNPRQSGIIESDGTANITGAAINIPVELQFRKFQEVVPGIRRLGVLTDPKHTGRVVEDARRAARKLGIELVDEPVHDAAQVPAALMRLLDRGIDGLWTVPDSTVFPGGTKVLIKECARAGIPTMGMSPQMCKAGFLFALSVDFDANGRQAGELASRIVHGAEPRELDVVMPKDVGLVLNKHIAKYIGHEFTPGVLDSATTVFD